MKHLLIPSLSDLIQPGIFAIIDNRNIFIGYSSNILLSVSRQLTSIMDGVHTLKSYDEVQVLEFTHLDLKEKQTYWADYYKSQGYQVVNSSRLLRYKTRIRIDSDYNVLVEVVPRNKKSIICGVFSKVADAEAYCKLLESNNPIIPLIASNDLTVKYLKQYDKTKF